MGLSHVLSMSAWMVPWPARSNLETLRHARSSRSLVDDPVCSRSQLEIRKQGTDSGMFGRSLETMNRSYARVRQINLLVCTEATMNTRSTGDSYSVDFTFCQPT